MADLVLNGLDSGDIVDIGSTDIDYALPSGGVLTYDPGTTAVGVGIPPLYDIQYVTNVYVFRSSVGRQPRLAFEYDITDKRGNLVPVPSSMTLNVVDADRNALSPAVKGSPLFDDHTIPAYIQTVGALVRLPVPDEVSTPYYVQGSVALDDGTGVQMVVFETLIRILA